MPVFRKNKPTVLVFGRGEVLLHAKKGTKDITLLPRSADVVTKCLKRKSTPRPVFGDVVLRFPTYESLETVIGALLRMYPADFAGHPNYSVLQMMHAELKKVDAKAAVLVALDLDAQKGKGGKTVYTTFAPRIFTRAKNSGKHRVFKHPVLAAPYGTSQRRKLRATAVAPKRSSGR